MKTAYAGAALALALAASTASAQNVKITPLGSHEGELCASDRATLFEDPTGVRFLYDAGHTVTGSDDPRLGNIHIVKGVTPHLAISGRTMEFNGAGKCVVGC